MTSVPLTEVPTPVQFRRTPTTIIGRSDVFVRLLLVWFGSLRRVLRPGLVLSSGVESKVLQLSTRKSDRVSSDNVRS